VCSTARMDPVAAQQNTYILVSLIIMTSADLLELTSEVCTGISMEYLAKAVAHDGHDIAVLTAKPVL